MFTSAAVAMAADAAADVTDMAKVNAAAATIMNAFAEKATAVAVAINRFR